MRAVSPASAIPQIATMARPAKTRAGLLPRAGAFFCIGSLSLTKIGSQIPYPVKLVSSAGKCLLQRDVVAVDIVEEMDFTAGFHHRSRVEDQDRNRLIQIYLEVVLPIVHRGGDTGCVPSWFIAQHPRRKRRRVFDSDASMTEVAARSREKLKFRRAVQVDVVVIRKDELGQPQGVLGSRSLPNGK